MGYISHAGKPFSRGFRKAANRLGLSMREIAVIGDQIFTDVFGGNRAGALTCYVETLDRRFFWINVRYQLERGLSLIHIFSSLIISITLVPLLCYFLLGGTKQQSIKPQGSGATPITEKPLSRAYRSSLNFLITHLWAGVALTVVICIVSVLSVSQAGMELIPEMDEGEVSVTVSMPNGSTMEDLSLIHI